MVTRLEGQIVSWNAAAEKIMPNATLLSKLFQNMRFHNSSTIHCPKSEG
jgi:hypothetical protein